MLPQEKFSIDEESLVLMRASCPPDATESEFKTFIYLCKQYNLDPIKKEIYFLKYAGKPSFITSRDGYLKLANMHPKFDGIESDVVYQGDSLTRRENGSYIISYGDAHYAFDRSKIIGAFCNVYRKDRSKAAAVFCSMADYQKKSQIWSQYPNAMIQKCAESMALKRAFAFSGLVSEEEIGHQPPQEVIDIAHEPELISELELNNLTELIDGDLDLTDKLLQHYKINSLNELHRNYLPKLIEGLEKRRRDGTKTNS